MLACVVSAHGIWRTTRQPGQGPGASWVECRQEKIDTQVIIYVRVHVSKLMTERPTERVIECLQLQVFNDAGTGTDEFMVGTVHTTYLGPLIPDEETRVEITEEILLTRS